MAKPTRLEKIQSLVADFRVMQSKYANQGAYDSEPSRTFNQLVQMALNGDTVVVPTGAEAWELYTRSMACAAAACALHAAAEKVVDAILKVPNGELGEVRHYYGGGV